jgi:hypothetical protein
VTTLSGAPEATIMSAYKIVDGADAPWNLREALPFTAYSNETGQEFRSLTGRSFQRYTGRVSEAKPDGAERPWV